jgi:hypothetical protein
MPVNSSMKKKKKKKQQQQRGVSKMYDSYDSKIYVSFCLAKLYEHAKFDFGTFHISLKFYNGQILKIMKARIMNSLFFTLFSVSP